jgi:hypothetical protein
VTNFATSPTLLASLDGAEGGVPDGGNLIADAARDLFGMAAGQCFKLVKTGSSHGAPILLPSLDRFNG